MLGLNVLYNCVFHFEQATDVSHVPEQFRTAHLAKRKAQIKHSFEQVSPDRRLHFRLFCRNQKHDKLETLLFGNTTDEIDMDPGEYEDYVYYCVLPSDAEIEERFERKTFPFPLFKKDDAAAKAMFVKFYKAGFLQAAFFERSDFGSYEAYQMLALFYRPELKKQNPFTWIERYIKMSNAIRDPQPLRTALRFKLPKNVREERPVDLTFWQNLISRKTSAIRLFAHADILTDEVKQSGSLEALEHKAMTTTYPRHAENPTLAQLCWQYVVPKEEFDECLEVDKEAKTEDRMPDVSVEMHSENRKYHYVLTKLPARDPRGYILGEMTDCCQHIGGYGEQCTIDGMQLPTSGFYVLLKGPKNGATHGNPLENPNYRVVAQAYAWLSQNNALVLDSWESLTGEDTKFAATILQRFGEQAIKQHPTLTAVLIGTGGGTPKALKTSYEYAEKMQAGKQYGDSKSAYAISTAPQYNLLLTFSAKVNAFLSKYRFQGYFHAYTALKDDMLASPQLIADFEQLDNHEFSRYWQHLAEDARLSVDGYYDIFAKYCKKFMNVFDVLVQNDRISAQETFDNLVFLFPRIYKSIADHILAIPPEKQKLFANVFHEICCVSQDVSDEDFTLRFDNLCYLTCDILEIENGTPNLPLSFDLVDWLCSFERSKQGSLAHLLAFLHPVVYPDLTEAIRKVASFADYSQHEIDNLVEYTGILDGTNLLTRENVELILPIQKNIRLETIATLLELGVTPENIRGLMQMPKQLTTQLKACLQQLKAFECLDTAIANKLASSHVDIMIADALLHFLSDTEHRDLLKQTLSSTNWENLTFAVLLGFTKLISTHGEKGLKSIDVMSNESNPILEAFHNDIILLLAVNSELHHAMLDDFTAGKIITHRQADQIRRLLTFDPNHLLAIFELSENPSKRKQEHPEIFAACILDLCEFIAYITSHQAIDYDVMEAFCLDINDANKIQRCVDVARLLVKHDQFTHDTALALASNTQDYDQVERALKLLLENHTELVTTNRLLQLLKNPDIAEISLSLMLEQCVSRAGMFAHNDGLARSQELVVERSAAEVDLRKSA